ncbi:hypothetical protein DFH08DRAFT_816827 [Mycena albidolilacea]|uniref:DDE-1 domain-containing protein n=1 Tax=Mycena albidolilacea TaxID=1033008 RepID=A0AAD7EIS7_9AGAR|nr:hypothetical protein DFH08DRAFT_816827 [Mycena albidolilacea]
MFGHQITPAEPRAVLVASLLLPTMPKGPPKRSTAPRGPNGMFLSTQSHPNTSGSSDESENLSSDSDNDIGPLELDSELEQDPDYTEDWERQPQPTTFEERRKMNEEKRARIAAKKRNAEIRSAEHRLAGPANPQQGKKRGPYGIGGTSARTIREKSKKLRDDFKNSTLRISHEELQRQLEAIKSQGSSENSGQKQQNIADMFGMAQKRPWAASILSEDDIPRASGISSSSGRSKRLKTAPVPEEEEESSSEDDIQVISGMSSAPVPEEEEESSSSDESEILDEIDISPEELESAARQKEGDAAVDSIAVADNIAEWVDTILEDAAPLETDQLQSLASDCLKAARKNKDYRSTVLLAALVDFYHWMPRMGRVYWDGHERKDVKQRRKAYLAELEAFESFRSEFAEPDMMEVMPELEENDIEHVVIVHDEATVHSNDYDGNHYWLKEGEQVLKKKGRGRLIMISAFLCEHYGLLTLTDDMVAENEKMAAELRLAITDSTTVIYPDNKAGGDAYWNLQQMIEQLIKAILIARRLFPKAIIYWVFDNSSAHGSLAPNALTATKMNVNPGGKVPEMHDTIIPADNPHGQGGKIQKMIFDAKLPDDHPYKQFEGLPKGMNIILAERGYTKDGKGKKLIGDCQACKAAKSRKPHLDGASTDEEGDMFGDDGNDTEEELDECPVDCCMRRLLSLQPDFAGEKSQLELVSASAALDVVL